MVPSWNNGVVCGNQILILVKFHYKIIFDPMPYRGEVDVVGRNLSPTLRQGTLPLNLSIQQQILIVVVKEIKKE